MARIEIEIDNYFEFDSRDAGLGDDATVEDVIDYMKRLSFMTLISDWNFRDGCKIYADGEEVAQG